MTSPQIYLIGTAHFDRLGRTRLESVLDFLQPDAVFVEGSEAFYARSPLLVKQLEEELMKELVKEGSSSRHLREVRAFFEEKNRVRRYERNVCDEYAQRNQKALHYLDSLEYTDKSLKIAEKIIQRENEDFKRMMLSLQPEDRVPQFSFYYGQTDANYDLFDDALEGRCQLPESVMFNFFNPEFREHALGVRDEHFEQVLRENAQGTNAVVVGIYHILDDPFQQTLYERIRDLQPQRKTVRGWKKQRDAANSF